jgi:hypothetical protein
MRDGTHLQRIGNHHPLHVRCHQFHHRHRVAGGLNNHLGVFAKTFGKGYHALAHEIDPPQLLHTSLINHRGLSETAMDVEPNDPHVLLLYFVQEHEGRHDNYGSALAAQPGRSQGRSLTNSGSQPIVRSTCPPSVLRAPLSRLLPRLRRRTYRRRRDPAHVILVTNVIESSFATIRHRTVRSKGCLSNKTALAMIFKLAEAAEKSWRRLDGQTSCRSSSSV